MYGSSRNTKSYIHRYGNSNRLTPLERKLKRNVSAIVTRRMLIKLLVTALKMHNSAGICTINAREIFRYSGKNNNSRVWTRRIV